MGKDLHHTILKFLQKRLDNHSMVTGWSRADEDDYIVYDVERKKYADRVKILLSDAYLFTEFDFINRPKIECDFILIAKPEGGYSVKRTETDAAKIGVGKLGEMMGALNSKEMWTYTAPSDEELRKRRERLRK